MANLIEVKEKLRQLRSSADWDTSMISQMNLWEKQIAWAEDNNESFYRLPKVVELSGILESRLAYVNNEINNNRKLNSRQRDILFFQRDLIEIELGIFRYSDFIEGIEKQIDFEADVFKQKDIEEAIDEKEDLP